MRFASTELAARIERAETSLIAESVESARRRRPQDDAFVIPIVGGAACFAGAGSPLNKVVGLGFGETLDEADLARIERAYAERGCPAQIELATLADPSIGAALTGRGYRLVGFENVLGLDLTQPRPQPERAAAIAVAPAGDIAAWAAIVVDGFAAPDSEGVASHEHFPREIVECAMRDMGGVAGFTPFIATIRGAPAGGASMRVHAGVAHLCGAATLPTMRRQGVQTALLDRRLSDAARLGCDLAVMTTLPGSKSQENAQRRGFELLYARAALVKER